MSQVYLLPSTSGVLLYDSLVRQAVRLISRYSQPREEPWSAQGSATFVSRRSFREAEWAKSIERTTSNSIAMSRLNSCQSDLPCQPSAVSRFIREAKAASALNHPNIVTILDAGTSKGRRFIIMEVVRGRTLRELIGHPATPEILLPIMTQIARALATAHAAGIVHRDIKPENIMVRDDGYVKVLDFGLAYWETAKSKESSTAPTRTISGSLVGTLRYMSPEQATGERPTASTDIFSLGIVIYELVTGRHPFEARNELEALQAICSRPILSPRHWIPGIPSTFETLILRMMDRTPELRPTAADIVRVLGEVDVRSLSTEVAPAISSRPPLVGRHQEIVKLRALLDSTHRGRGLLALITGEPRNRQNGPGRGIFE